MKKDESYYRTLKKRELREVAKYGQADPSHDPWALARVLAERPVGT